MVAILLPDRQEQALQPVVEEIEEVPRRIAVFAVAQGLLAIEGRQRRAGTEQADQVDAQARAQLAVLFEELHAIDIAAGKAQARIGLQFQALIQRLFIQFGMGGVQAFQHQLHTLEQAVFADAPTQAA
ncbi:hypothetical protein D3C80_1268450 [compost metagenome]